MLRDNEADECAAAAEAADNDKDAAAIGGAIEATPAPLFNPMPSADCAETELTEEEGAMGPLWEIEAAEEGGGTEGATAETDEKCKLESPSMCWEEIKKLKKVQSKIMYSKIVCLQILRFKKLPKVIFRGR